MQVDTMDPSLCNSTLMDPLNVTDSSSCTGRVVYQALPRSTPIAFLPVLSWRWCCSLATDAICLLHSVDSSVLSYTVKSPPSWSIAQKIKKLVCVQIWNVRVPSFPFVQFKLLVYGHTITDRQTDRQTYTHVLQCSHASVRLAQVRPN